MSAHNHTFPPAGITRPDAGTPAPSSSSPQTRAAAEHPNGLRQPQAVGQTKIIPDLPGTGPGGSIASVLECRLEQIAKGHTPEDDLKLPDCWLENGALHFLNSARLHRQKGLAHARRSYVRAAAMLLAQIDRIDALASLEEGTPA